MGFNPVKAVQQAAAPVAKAVTTIGKTGVGAGLGGLAGSFIPGAGAGLAGGIGGGIAGGGFDVGGIAGGVLKNTPFDHQTWKDTAGRISGGGGKKEMVTTGANIPLPSISGYQDLSTLGNRGVLQAQTLQESPWASMAVDKQATEQGKLFDNAIGQQQSALAQGRANLAMRGGLSGGAAERMNMQGVNDLATNRQNILSQGVMNRAGLGMQAADRATDIGKFNIGQQSGADQFNVSQSIGDLARKNEQDRFKYGEEMKLKGAGMSADAIANAGKK